MMRTVVGVLRGGTSNEYDLSLKTGAAMIASLPEDRYDVRDIFIDKVGIWHVRGVPVAPARVLSQIDVVLNGLHGGIGEDGTVSRIMEISGVRYAGPRPLAASVSLHKMRARQTFREAGIRMPRGISFSLSNDLTTAEMAQAVFSQFGPPYVIKPSRGGAGEGIRFSATVLDLPDAIGDVLDAFGDVLVEEFIRGKQATVGIVERFRGEDLYAFPPAETELPEGKRLYDFESHTGGLAKHRCPSAFTHDQKRTLMNAARQAHTALQLSHYSRSDFIVAPHGIYLLETNALPGLYEGAPLPHMLDAVGATPGHLCEHLVALATDRV